MRKRLSFLSIMLVAIVLCACGTKVKARHMEPARFPVAGIRTISVAQFQTHSILAAPWGRIISDRIARELKKGSFYEVKGLTDFEASAESDELDPAWRRWGEEP